MPLSHRQLRASPPSPGTEIPIQTTVSSLLLTSYDDLNCSPFLGL